MNRYWKYFKEKAVELYDSFLFIINVTPKEAKSINAGEKRIILFIGQKLDPRIPRLTKWINTSQEYSTVIFCHKDYYTQEFVSKKQGAILFYRNAWHLKRVISSIKVYLIHGYAPLSYFPSVALTASKENNIPFIIDYQDVYVTYFGKDPNYDIAWFKKDLTYEEICFKNANGMIACSMEPFIADRIWNDKKISPRLFFPLYADNEAFIINNSKISSDEIHLVYIGGISRKDFNSYFGGIADLHWLIDILSLQKIHLHVYPSPTVTKFHREDYEKISLENSYFHLHDPIDQANLSKELSQYHYGLIPFFKGTSEYTDAKFRNAATLKIFNYLEAGIPVLTSEDYAFQAWLSERYKLGRIFKNKEDFRDLISKISETPYELQIENLIKGREKLSLKYQYPRVLKFYDSFNKVQ
jgi:hypothetical protein